MLPRLAGAALPALALLALTHFPSASGAAERDEAPEDRRGITLPARLVLEGEALERLPSAESYHHLFDHYFLPTMFSHEESMGYSDIDPERLTILGNSAAWTEWRLEDLNLSDPMFEGAAAFKVPFAFLSGIEVRHAESARHAFGGGIRFGVAPSDRPARRGTLSLAQGGFGDIVGIAHPIMKQFSGLHPRDRVLKPDADRRRVNGRIRADATDAAKLGGDHTLRWAVEVDATDRHHLDFPGFKVESSSVPFDEQSLRTTAIAELAPEGRAWRAFALGEYRQRSHLFAEREFGLAETQSLASGGLLLGVLTDAFRAGATFKQYRTAPNDPDFARELVDLDGEGTFPYVPGGVMNALRLDLGYRAKYFYASSDSSLLGWNPGVATSTHALTYEGRPYGTMTLESRPTTTWLGTEKVGYSGVETRGKFEIAFDAYVQLSHAHAAGMDALVEPGLGTEAEVVAKVSPKFEPFAAVGRTPIPITPQLALALTPGYLKASERLVDGTLTQTVGGEFTRLGEDLGTASMYSLALGFTSRFGAGWTFGFQGMARTYTGIHRLAFDGPASKYGRTVDGVFYFDDGETRYLLEDTPSSMRPFGGSLQLEIAKAVKGESFFHTTFYTLNSIGHPPPQFGAYGNDIGLVDWSSANPNALVNSEANVDADRAYVLRMGAGRRLWRTLWGTLMLAFRDGQPFTFYAHHFDEGQLATTMRQNRGSPLKPTSPLRGPREDFQLEVDMQLSYDVPIRRRYAARLKLLGANVFDFGNEISERSPGVGRSTLETQLPRSLHFAVELVEVAAAAE